MILNTNLGVRGSRMSEDYGTEQNQVRYSDDIEDEDLKDV